MCLSGVVIWTLQASCLEPQTFRTRFRSLFTKKRASKVCQNRTSSVDVTMPVHCFPFLSQHLHNNWSPLGRAVFPCAPTACQRHVLFFCLLCKGFFFFFSSDMMLLIKSSWKPHSMFAAQSAAVGPFAKSARPSLNFFFSDLGISRAEMRTRKFDELILITFKKLMQRLHCHDEV